MKALVVLLVVASSLLALPSTAAAAQPAAAEDAPAAAFSLEPFLGVWSAVQKEEGQPQSMVEIGRDYFSVARGDKLDHREKVVAVEDGGLLVSLFGNRRHIRLELDGDELVATHEIPRTLFNPDPEPSTQRYRRLEERPAAFGLAPLPLGDAQPLAEERVAALEAELVRRGELDQEVRKPYETAGGQPTPDDMKRMGEVDADNTAWLIEQIADVGWIDSQRFSREAAEAAFLIVQHSGNLRLMATALPAIHADVEATGEEGGRYALLYDRFRMWRSERQRYGSQLGYGADGLFLYPLEDPETVDQRRKELGMEPLAAYLERFAERNDGKPVEVREDF